MKKSKYIIIALMLIFASLAFSGCRGSANVANSWAGITVEGDTAYVAFNQYVYMLDLDQDGRILDTFPDNQEDLRPRNPTFFHAPVILDDNTLLVGSYNNRMFTFNTQNGSADDFFIEARNRWIAKPLLHEGTIYAPNANGTLYALGLNGNPKWEFETNAAIWATPVMNGSRLYMVSQDHTLYALNPSTGDLVWSLDLGAATVNSPALDDNGMLYIGTFGSKVIAIDAAAGEIAWEIETRDWVWGSPVIGEDGVLYVTDLGANLYAIDTATQDILWEKSVDEGSSITGSALLAGESLIVATQSGQIASYGLDGERLWREEFGDEDNPVEFHGTPVLAGDDLILVSAIAGDTVFYAFNTELESLWTFEPEN
jgi:outer membrane protein assembly factor BamB